MFTEEPGKPTRDFEEAMKETETYLEKSLAVDLTEDIPVKLTEKVPSHPLLRRYFVKVKPESLKGTQMTEDDFIVKIVMHINDKIDNAFVFSSGKNMGAFKGAGYPEDIADFFMLEDYEGHTWTAHNRFPTNTQGWWGGAHPFTLLDWSIVHNGEISSYGINKRYLEMFGYKLALLTDTEVVTYIFDLLVRRQGLPISAACLAVAAPFWKDIDRMEESEREACEGLRMVYGSGAFKRPVRDTLRARQGSYRHERQDQTQAVHRGHQGQDGLYVERGIGDTRDMPRPRESLGSQGRTTGSRRVTGARAFSKDISWRKFG